VSDQIELRELKEIDQKLILLEEKSISQNEKISVLVKKRNKLNMKVRELSQDIRINKVERDKLNNKVKVLKENRNKTHIEIKKKVEIINKFRNKIDILKEKLPNRNSIDLRNEFDALEWRIQTTTLELDEEKRLVEKVKILGTQISKYKKIEKQNVKIMELRRDIKKQEIEANKAHIELTELANKSQELHSLISSKLDELKITKDKADQLHISYSEFKKQNLPIRTESRELVQKKRKLLNSIKEKDDKKRKETEKNLKIKIKTEAQTKIKNNEKLSWNEFKLLTESNHGNNK
jgi:uncharacterized coiled-coil DUF342 family protein